MHSRGKGRDASPEMANDVDRIRGAAAAALLGLQRHGIGGTPPLAASVQGYQWTAAQQCRQRGRSCAATRRTLSLAARLPVDSRAAVPPGAACPWSVWLPSLFSCLRNMQNWDGSGGNGAALRHFESTGRKYPLVVKLGTITPHGADVYRCVRTERVVIVSQA